MPRDHIESEAVGEIDDRPEQDVISSVRFLAGDERSVDLQDVDVRVDLSGVAWRLVVLASITADPGSR
jgi:hypothetical protein